LPLPIAPLIHQNNVTAMPAVTGRDRMSQPESEHFDAVVIGGGPGGSTAATFIAMQGHRVLLLERERFPRHQIGESLLPATVHGICPLLGVSAEIAGAGFPRKLGGTLRWGKQTKPWTFRFARNPDAPGGYAYQVERSRFDQMLLDNARRKGVVVREEHAVQEILFEEGRASGVLATDSQGSLSRIASRFVLDAGGHRSRQYNPHVGERVFSKFFQNIALYAYFENGKRLAPPYDGNIFSAAFNEGWLWYIPLSDRLTSVGAVIAREAAKTLQDGHDVALQRCIAACPPIADLLANATRVTEGMYGQFRIRKDFSYSNTRFWRPGLVLIGDAACFIDPIFSSGVHLSTYAALLAARSVNTVLRGTIDEHACFAEYERRYRREFGNFYQFLVAFYDMHQDRESYFWEARKILNTDEKSNTAFVRLVAGLSSSEEPLFNSTTFFEVRGGFGDWFEEHIAQQSEGAVLQGGGMSHAKEGFDPARFMQGFTTEIVQLQMMAQFGASHAPNAPIAVGGLVASADGFHWARPQRPPGLPRPVIRRSAGSPRLPAPRS
jgi:FAD-dependent halogenase